MMVLSLSLLLALGAATCSTALCAEIPQFVKDYAPKVWLHSEDPYLPADIQTHISNTQPEVNFTVVDGAPGNLSVDNLDSLNNLGGASVYLTSKVDITTNPSWLNGVAPTDEKTEDAISCAVIINDHQNGTVDAFYMYFYSFDWGGEVKLFGEFDLGNFGDHVGDWEHTMVRFVDSKPTYVWLSQHSNGEAFKYDILEKDKTDTLRPIVYSANGTHANYAIDGTHDHTIPNLNLPADGILADFTDQGKLWDPTASAWWYSYTPSPEKFTSLDASPTAWLAYIGQWGDQQYPDSDKRQDKLFGQPRYASGPTGPRAKQLDRVDVCPDDGDECILRDKLGP